MTEDIRGLFVETARGVIGLVEQGPVAASWSEPSSLPEYSVGGLAAHLCRAIVTVDGYLTEGAAAPGAGSPISPAEYFLSALGDHDPIDSDHHHGIRQRSADMAASGQGDVIDAARDAVGRLAVSLPVTASPFVVSVFGGLEMDLDDYLRTRLVELCVHSDDLLVAVEGVSVELSNAAWAVTRRVLVDLAAIKLGERRLALSLSRRERTERPLAL